MVKVVVRIGCGGALAALFVAACGGSDATPGSGTSSTTSSSSGTGAAGGGDTTSTTGTGAAKPCPHEGSDVLDPGTLPVCPMCAGGARCVPSNLIPPESAAQLGDCDADHKCVPDDFIKSGGDFIATTCTSVAGGEGRCLSECLPDIAAQAALLPVDTCPEFQRCAPCYDPITGEETGACALSCDPGPTSPPVTLPSCCMGIGTCVPKALVPPEQAASLPQDSCPKDTNDYVCAPTAFITDPSYMPDACLTESLIGGGEPGVCLPECLITGIEGALLGQSTCAAGWKCAPCTNPITGQPTGACDL